MILQTGGSAFATISTRSRSASSAARNASFNETIPFCSPSAPTRRTSFARISSLSAGRLLLPPCCWLRSGCLIFITPQCTGRVRQRLLSLGQQMHQLT